MHRLHAIECCKQGCERVDHAGNVVFVPVGSAMIAIHSNHLILASNANGQRYSLLCVKVKSFLLTFCNGQTDR